MDVVQCFACSSSTPVAEGGSGGWTISGSAEKGRENEFMQKTPESQFIIVVCPKGGRSSVDEKNYKHKRRLRLRERGALPLSGGRVCHRHKARRASRAPHRGLLGCSCGEAFLAPWV